MVDKRDRDYRIRVRKIRQGKQDRFGTNKDTLDFKKTAMEEEKRKKKIEEENRRKKEVDAVNFLEDRKIIAAIGEELAKEFCEEKGKIEKGHEIVIDFHRLGFVAQVKVIEVINRTSKLKMVCDINGKEVSVNLSDYIKALKKMQDCNLEQDCKNC